MGLWVVLLLLLGAVGEGEELPVIIRGQCSWFGGPGDSGVKPTEGLSLIREVRPENKHLFLDHCRIGEKALARGLNPSAMYAAMRLPLMVQKWTLTGDNISGEIGYWCRFRILVRYPESGVVVALEMVDTGPAQWTGKELDISRDGAMKRLGCKTGDTVEIYMLGPVEEWPVLPTPEEAGELWERLEGVRMAYLEGRR